MKEVRRIHAKRHVKDVLCIRNGKYASKTLQLSPYDDVLVWHEKDNWTGPVKILAIDGETCTVNLSHGPTNFRSTVIKSYYKDDQAEIPTDKNSHCNSEPIGLEENDWTPINEKANTSNRGRGGPKG